MSQKLLTSADIVDRMWQKVELVQWPALVVRDCCQSAKVGQIGTRENYC